jgi:hypothetical protein
MSTDDLSVETGVEIRVANSHNFNADPDPDLLSNADPDTAFHLNADPDPAPHLPVYRPSRALEPPRLHCKRPRPKRL